MASDGERILTCVYCGHEYPAGTPPAGNELLTAHIRQCEKHPMRELEQQVVKLRRALVGLVGEEDPDTLAQMEAVIRLAPMPDEDRAYQINALHAIRDTAPVRPGPADVAAGVDEVKP